MQDATHPVKIERFVRTEWSTEYRGTSSSHSDDHSVCWTTTFYSFSSLTSFGIPKLTKVVVQFCMWRIPSGYGGGIPPQTPPSYNRPSASPFSSRVDGRRNDSSLRSSTIPSSINMLDFVKFPLLMVIVERAE